jgi:hypothetical protein
VLFSSGEAMTLPVSWIGGSGYCAKATTLAGLRVAAALPNESRSCSQKEETSPAVKSETDDPERIEVEAHAEPPNVVTANGLP